MKTLKIAVSRACPECFTTSRDIVDITASDYIDVAAVVLAVSDIFNGAIEEIEATGFGIPVFIATHKEERVPAEFLSRIHGVFQVILKHAILQAVACEHLRSFLVIQILRNRAD